MSNELYYIQNKGYFGNSLRWWKPDGGGYTSDLNKAWRLTLAEAERICSSRPREDYPRLCVEVDQLAQRHVDAQSLPNPKRWNWRTM